MKLKGPSGGPRLDVKALTVSLTLTIPSLCCYVEYQAWPKMSTPLQRQYFNEFLLEYASYHILDASRPNKYQHKNIKTRLED